MSTQACEHAEGMGVLMPHRALSAVSVREAPANGQHGQGMEGHRVQIHCNQEAEQWKCGGSRGLGVAGGLEQCPVGRAVSIVLTRQGTTNIHFTDEKI